MKQFSLYYYHDYAKAYTIKLFFTVSGTNDARYNGREAVDYWESTCAIRTYGEVRTTTFQKIRLNPQVSHFPLIVVGKRLDLPQTSRSKMTKCRTLTSKQHKPSDFIVTGDENIFGPDPAGDRIQDLSDAKPTL